MNKLTPTPKIYLAGGMRSNWQDTVKAALAEAYTKPVLYLDPRQHGSRDENLYTSWDLAAVEASNILFVYLEKDNPDGHGLALEIGFALGMAQAGAAPKHVIYVEEPGHPASRYLGMARACADETLSSLEDGPQALQAHLAVLR